MFKSFHLTAEHTILKPANFLGINMFLAYPLFTWTISPFDPIEFEREYESENLIITRILDMETITHSMKKNSSRKTTAEKHLQLPTKSNQSC